MTTFAQWRSPSRRPVSSRFDRNVRNYDIRIVDRFYAYCQTVARTDSHRETLAHSQQTAKRSLWTMLVAGSLLCYYLVDRVAQAMSLF